MERLQNCWASVSWTQETSGFDVNAILSHVMANELQGDQDVISTTTGGVHLSSPVTRGSADAAPEPCLLELSCQQHLCMVSVVVISEARHIECYSNEEYCGTARGSKIDIESDQNSPDVLYQCDWKFEKPVKSCTMKFLSLRDKYQMWLHHVRLTLDESRHVDINDSGLNKPSIDMSEVRRMLGSMNQQVDDKAQRLMTSVEDYQKNQSAMLGGIQSLTRDSTPANAGDNTTGMLGMLSMLNNLSTLQIAPRTTNAVDVNDTSGSADQNAMYSMLKNVCSEVTIRRKNQEDSKEMMEKSTDETFEKNERPTLDSHVVATQQDIILEERLTEKINQAEERILKSVERQISALQIHIDNRLDTILAMLTNKNEIPVD
ncbi:ATPase PAAT-like [Saccoglossus kowalevskii]|uniref:Uncharacterized protein C10orf88-like n=1 Tax=Saccoglossus kowalevskii TaxID=10224 RepID=A0ABM0MK32_SACKO|nr:PREDICTED: uncharacterized protein C10orf88-like [Saccoglossus kowalevskii]